MASSSGSGGGDKNPIQGGGGDKNPVPGGKNPIMGRRIDQGFYEALWELILRALGYNIPAIPQNRAPAAAGTAEKPPLHPKTSMVIRMARDAKAIPPKAMTPSPKKASKTPNESFPSVRGRVNPEVYEERMRGVLQQEVRSYFEEWAGEEETAEAPLDQARRNLREYLPFMIQQAGFAAPTVRGLSLSVEQGVRRYFVNVARAERPDLVDPPRELQQYLQELVAREAQNFYNAMARAELEDMYADDDFEDGDDDDDEA